MAACRRAAVSCNLVGPPVGFLRAAAALPSVLLAFASARPPPAKRLTENASPTFDLDFFFHHDSTPAARVASLLVDTWAAEPNTALHLACNLLGVRGMGKYDRTGFYATALLMHECHPAPLALNAPSIIEFGYLKVLLEILHRISHGGGVSTNTTRKKVEARAPAPRRGYSAWTRRSAPPPLRSSNGRSRGGGARRPPQERSNGTTVIQTTGSCTTARRTYSPSSSLGTCESSPTASSMRSPSPDTGKWCPSLNCCYDRYMLLSEAIACRLFPKGLAPDLPEDMADEHYVYEVRNCLRKVLASLRPPPPPLPNIFITAQVWGVVVYPRVVSKAMRKYKDLFFKHDTKRFKLYLADVEIGKAKIAAGALLLHEILQWERMVNDLRALSKLSNCIAIYDVLGNMSGVLLDVCIALSLLISKLSDEPWHHRLITFSAWPEIHQITGKTLWEKTIFIRQMHWLMNTDFQVVFDKLLSIAVADNLPPEQMSSSRPWETDNEAITRKFTKAGYGVVVLEIVLWNLRGTMSVPGPRVRRGSYAPSCPWGQSASFPLHPPAPGNIGGGERPTGAKRWCGRGGRRAQASGRRPAATARAHRRRGRGKGAGDSDTGLEGDGASVTAAATRAWRMATRGWRRRDTREEGHG
ncbi:hypothetical protein SETIT_4G194300v2 [Setaria italica]|uniref:Uncharacterized protein n=1 Tax=Setaria italica TaxID=4555 RepID=K3Y248_SETIT|nr:hypothetical protein SETIT_4G194300v2 [Setaria italica]